MLTTLILALAMGTTDRESKILAQDRSTSVTLKMLRAVLGKSEDGKEMKALYDLLGKPVIKKGSGVAVYSWKAQGIVMGIDIDDGVTSIELSREYRGELPEKLTFQDTRADVHKKLGKPQKVLDADPKAKTGVIDDYSKKKVMIDYDSKDAAETKCRIQYISLFR